MWFTHKLVEVHTANQCEMYFEKLFTTRRSAHQKTCNQSNLVVFTFVDGALPPVSESESRALRASRWSLLLTSCAIDSSNLTFSIFNSCRHDNNCATAKTDLIWKLSHHCIPFGLHEGTSDTTNNIKLGRQWVEKVNFKCQPSAKE